MSVNDQNPGTEETSQGPPAPPPHANVNAEYEYGEFGENVNREVGSDPDEMPSGKVLGGAAVVGGLAGLVIAGPILGVAAGVGAAALATTKGAGGDVARASGDVAVATGERAKKIDEKYQVADKTKHAVNGTVEKAKQFNEKHQVTDKVKKSTDSMVESAKKFDEKHRIREKTSKGLSAGAKFISSKLRKDKS